MQIVLDNTSFTRKAQFSQQLNCFLFYVAELNINASLFTVKTNCSCNLEVVLSVISIVVY